MRVEAQAGITEINERRKAALHTVNFDMDIINALRHEGLQGQD